MLNLYDAVLELKQAGFKSVFDDVLYISIEDALTQAQEDESGEVYSVSVPYIFKAPVRPTENVPVWVGSKEEITVEPPSEYLTTDEVLLFRMFDAFRANWPEEEEPAKALILSAAVALRGRAKGGKRGGKAKSEAKAQAVRENGKKGGRPRSFRKIAKSKLRAELQEILEEKSKFNHKIFEYKESQDLQALIVDSKAFVMLSDGAHSQVLTLTREHRDGEFYKGEWFDGEVRSLNLKSGVVS